MSMDDSVKTVNEKPITRHIVGYALAVELLLECLSYIAVDSYRFSWMVAGIRIGLFLLCIALYRLFNKRSSLWFKTMNSSVKCKLISGALIGSICIFLSFFVRISGQIPWLEQGDSFEEATMHTQNGNQYNKLADAILDGHAYLDLPVSDILLHMDNPYDTEERTQLNTEQRDAIYWDYAYYEGHYYCYFGILPCLLSFVPFKLITGLDLRTDYVVLLFGCLAVVSGFLLLQQFVKTYFKKISIAHFICGFLALILFSGILEQVYLPRIYPIPILSSLFFCFTGLALWLKGKRAYEQSGKMNSLFLILGALSIAATLGCRPQYVLCAVLAFPLFWREIRDGQFFSIKGASNTAAVILPFILVAVPICYYNYVRFGSIADFGASYNLTGADMTSYRFCLPLILVRCLEYLLLPLSVFESFPFIAAINETQPFSFLWTNEPFYAGFFVLCPAALFVFVLVLRRGRAAARNWGLLPMIYVMLGLSAVVLMVISYVSGVTMRYFSDFGWLLGLAVILLFWSCTNYKHGRFNAGLVSVIRVDVIFALLVFVGIGLYLWTFLGTARIGALWGGSPDLYQLFESVFAFL